jgi:hypothetical protein
MSAFTGSLVFDPTATDDSSNVGAYVRAGSDGDLIASQTIAAEEWLNTASALFDSAGNGITSTGGALDVNFASGTVALASEYDEDAAHTSGDKGQFTLGIRVDDLSAVPASVLAGTEGDYQGLISNASGALYVAGVDFDIRSLDAATDNVAISDGTDTLGINADGSINITDNGGSLTVDATDLDIRDLTAASDSVAAWLSDGSGNAIGSTTGSLNVHVANAGDIDIDDDLADTAIENTATAVSTSAVNVVSSALADRKHLFLANLGNIRLYFGKTGVTTANGFPLFPREKLAARIGPSVAPQIIGAAGASAEDLRVMELS